MSALVDIWNDDDGTWFESAGVLHGPFRTEAEAEHRERLATDPDYAAEVAYRQAGGTDPQGPR